MSVSAFVSYSATPLIPAPFTDQPFIQHAADMCYHEKVRLFNLPRFTEHFSQFIHLADAFELYSKSSEGIREGCNASQTAQHRRTKMKAINGFTEALERGFLRSLGNGSMLDFDDKVNDMLADAKVTIWGDSTVGEVTTEALKKCIKKTGEELKINSLYKRGQCFKAIF